MNLVFPIILIAISVGTFLTYIDPHYQGIKELQKTKVAFQEKFDKADEINEKKQKLNDQYTAISSSDLTKINKFIPDHVNNIELIVDIDRIAKKNNIRNMSDITLIRDASKSVKKGVDVGKIKIKEDTNYSSVVLSFSFVSNYQNFQKFLDDLHKSLRLVDIVDLSLRLQENQGEESTGDNYMFTLSIRTYWINN